MTTKIILPFVCLLALTNAAMPMDMRGPGDEECVDGVTNPCDPSSTHCVQIKYYLAKWEYTDSEEADGKGVVCMCKRGYTPDPDDEFGCRNCEEGTACHEGDMNPEQCGHNSCDYYSQRCVPDVDSYLGYTCTCQQGFIENPYNPLACSWEPYVDKRGHKIMTANGDKIYSGSYGEEQYDGDFVDATRDAHRDSNTGGTVDSKAHQYVASTDEDHLAGLAALEESSQSESAITTQGAAVAMMAVVGGIALVAVAAAAGFASRKTITTTEANVGLTPAQNSV
jgi:hypothetical protein